MPRGRPVKSQIRQNIIEILYFIKQGYGYDIYKIYRDVFPPVTLRSVYYHLRKGTKIGEFKVAKIKSEKGDYSWGPEAEKIYYSLDENAAPKADLRVKKYLEKKKKKALKS
jgi:hypothetical protein